MPKPTFNPSSLNNYSIENFDDLAAKLDFFQFAVEMASDAIFLMHSDSELLFVNPSACERRGYSKDEMLGKFVWEWDPNVPQEAWPALWADIQDKKHIHFETLHTAKSGETFPVEIHAFYYRREQEEFVLSVCREVARNSELARQNLENELAMFKHIVETRIQQGDKETQQLLLDALNL